MFHKRSSSLIFQLTAVHTLIIAVLLSISSYFIYATACSLVDQLPAEGEQSGAVFREQLAGVLWFVVPAVIVAGAYFHYFFTKKMTRPLKQLGASLNELKAGRYDQLEATAAFYEIEQLSSHINELRDRLRENEETRARMMNDMAHELRTPLSNVSGYLEAMRDGVISGEPKLYHSLHEESQRLIDMVEQMQEMSRWNEQTAALLEEKEQLDPGKLLEETAELYRLKFEKRGIHFHAAAAPGTSFVHKKGMQQAFMNLLENAYQHYEGAGAVEVEGESVSNGYEIRVTSPGPELTEEDRKWMFERFYRADASRNRTTGGSGLGLAIVKNIIEKQHAGNVDVLSDGTRHSFRLFLPDSTDQR
ncbi:sensor histidine kinase [Alkalicoccus urumqiensis]|uniref:sensor histidine kinase n=1 Tax=Alkalicoccus urumqiensis TaxID=1548213 RepID=UPI0015E5F722|nr:HAMP domain-containing sensor histidine kinase [Alkalicoccus urumqiensis]